MAVLVVAGLSLGAVGCGAPTAGPAPEPAVSASPSGEAAVAGLPGNIYYGVGAPGAPEIRRVTGGAVTQVTKLKAGVERFRLSPDGTKVAYQVVRDLIVSAVDGSSPVKVDDLATGADFDWSPDSAQLVYTSWTPMNVDVKVVNADGSGQHTIGNGVYPVWSPDGEWIAFVFGRLMDQVSVVRPDGSQSRTVTVALAAGQSVWGLHSLSPGGREVFIAPDCPQCNNRLLARDFKGSLIVDTNTGATRVPAVTGGTAELVFWLKDGSTLTRIVTTPAPSGGGWPVYDVELRAPDGTVTARAPEPTTIHGLLFLYTAATG